MPVDLVEFEEGNPLEDTATGRVALLQFYSQLGILKTYEEVQQVVSTGRFEPALKGQRDELLLLHAEYELLQRGELPIIHPTQNHMMHYRENAVVLHSPSALKNQMVRQAAEQHLQGHYEAYFGVPMMGDPMVLDRHRFLMGLGPAPMPAGPPGAPAGPGGAPAPGPEGQPPALAPPPGAEPQQPEQPPGAPATGSPPLLQ